MSTGARLGQAERWFSIGAGLAAAAVVALILGCAQTAVAAGFGLRSSSDSAPAHRLLLRASDFPPGWTARPARRGWANCFDRVLGRIRPAASLSSPVYSDASATAAVTLAVVFRTPTIARLVFRREEAKIAQCYETLPPRAATVGIRKLAPPSLLSASRSVAFRLSYNYGHALPIVYLDLVLVRDGTAVAFAYFGDLTTPFPGALERRLVLTLTRPPATAASQ